MQQHNISERVNDQFIRIQTFLPVHKWLFRLLSSFRSTPKSSKFFRFFRSFQFPPSSGRALAELDLAQAAVRESGRTKRQDPLGVELAKHPGP